MHMYLFFLSLVRVSLGFSPFSTLCTASLESSYRGRKGTAFIYHCKLHNVGPTHVCSRLLQETVINEAADKLGGVKSSLGPTCKFFAIYEVHVYIHWTHKNVVLV